MNKADFQVKSNENNGFTEPGLEKSINDSKNKRKQLYAVLLVALYLVITNLPAPEGLTPEGQRAIALMVVGVVAWIVEVVPIGVASLVLVFLQPVIGLTPMGEAVNNFASPTLLFVVSSFFLAIALDVSGFGTRVSLKLTVMSGGSPKKTILYLMAATGALTTVISDIPACAAFFPIGLALVERNKCAKGFSNFAKAMLIGIPFASLIGGVATPAGSSLNVLSLSLLKSTADIEISFAQWSAIGIPVVILLIPIAWKILVTIFPPELEQLTGLDEVKKEYRELGPLSKQEIKFLSVFALLLITWFTESFHGIPLPASITLGAAIFFLPGFNLLNWENTKNRIGWDTILLIGAASSLGTALWQSGAASWIAEATLSGIEGASVLVVVMVVIVFTILIHLLVPVNPAIVSIMVPTLAAFAVGAGMNPAFLVIPMGFSVSAAFLLPLDPVPLITYASGYYKMTDFFKAGWVMSVAWTIVMTVAMLLIARPMGLF